MGKKIIYNSQKIRNSNNKSENRVSVGKMGFDSGPERAKQDRKNYVGHKKHRPSNTDAFLTSFRGQDLTVVGVIND